jgi:polygalacturonase
MMIDRRRAVMGGLGLAGAGAIAAPAAALAASAAERPGWFDARRFGAAGDGVRLDTAAINRAIDAAAAAGGGTVLLPPGTYACHTIRLKSRVALHLDIGATLLAAPPPTGSGPGYDLPEPQDPAIEPFQDAGHNHWRNSLIWGDGLHDIAVTGHGLIWGKGLGRGDGMDGYLRDPSGPGTANKGIALKNCRNVTLRDFRMLSCGWFAVLATGVDNLTIDNVLVDTTRDGFDIDCCRNVRVTNCTVNSPWDDGICPKSSYALGYARPTENLTIANCFVTGNYQVGSVLDGSWRPMPASFAKTVHGRIKFGTESNGGFRNITITNCVFDQSQGLAFESVDGAVFEDVTVSNITMRGSFSAPLFLRLGRRMRGPAGRPIGSMRRLLFSNIVSSGAGWLPSIIAGLPGHPIEDVKLSDIFVHQRGGAPAAMAARVPPLAELAYPEPTMFGDLPATGFFVRDARNVEFSNVEVAVEAPDPRAAFRFEDVDGADLFRTRVPAGAPAFSLDRVRDFRSFGARSLEDRHFAGPVSRLI